VFSLNPALSPWSRSLVRHPLENPRAETDPKVIVALTVQEILDEHIETKLL
jgi:hypothetical protein